MTMNATLQADYAALQTAISNAGTLQGAAFSTIAPILAAAEQLSTDLASAISTLDATVAGGMNSGTDPVVAATYLTTHLAAANNEYALLMGKAFVDRIDLNLLNNAG